MLANWDFVLIFAEQDNLKIRDKGGKRAKCSHWAMLSKVSYKQEYNIFNSISLYK